MLELREAGWWVIVLDDLSTGRRGAAPAYVPFIEGDVGDRSVLASLFEKHRIRAVLHLAGLVIVPESVRQPLAYYRNNTVKSIALFEACVQASDGAFVLFDRRRLR